MRTLKTSVRRFVEFLLRTGDIDSGNAWRGSIEAMQAGSNIHRMLQASGGDAYQAEVPLACSFYYPSGVFDPYAARLEIREETVRDEEGFFLRVEGRADGIIDDGTHPLVVDEIKGVSRDVSTIKEPVAVHEAQALCYAYLYLRGTRGPTTLSTAFGDRVVVRLTYASMTTGEVRQIERVHNVPSIEAQFFSLLEAAQRWAAWRVRHDELRDASLGSLVFPFKPRDAQQEIMDAVATTIHDGGRLYVQAPTGSGKTIATLYPALKAMGQGELSRIALLTAKTMTRRSALDCLELLGQQQVKTNVLVVTARNKICPLRNDVHGNEVRARPLSSLCNPVECPYARGHYRLVNDALYEAIATYDVLDASHIEQVAARHHVCPYELQRDLVRWSDVVICDYHYAFAPSAGFFGLANEPGSGTAFLVDEAHNLPERMRTLYSAELTTADLKQLEHALRTRQSFAELLQAVRAVVAVLPVWDKTLPARANPSTKGQARRPDYQVVRMSDALVDALTALSNGIDATLEDLFPTPGGARGNEQGAGVPDGKMIETLLTLRDMSAKTHAFLATLQRAEVGYVTFLARADNGGRKLKVFCVDPSHDLDARLEQATVAVFFSGTLLPLDYHRKLLAAREEDASLYARSSFDYRHQQVLIGKDVSARFSQRGPTLYAHIAEYLMTLVQARPGNYLAFLPSYAMAEEVYVALGQRVDERVRIVAQRPGMCEHERESFVAEFGKPRVAGQSLVGLAVLGGIFGESIDLPGEALVGVVVVGTGMPMATSEREAMRDYYDAKTGKGFAYAYTYPGIIKVLQAAGRLIRTEDDHGVVLLLDDRFLEDELQQAFPKEWGSVRTCTLKTIRSIWAL